MSACLGRLMERSGVLPTMNPVCLPERFSGAVFCDALFCVSDTLKLSALESGQEARIVQIDFNAAFYRVNHHDILYKLFSAGYWRFCVVYTDTVSIKPITARYGGWLSELTG